MAIHAITIRRSTRSRWAIHAITMSGIRTRVTRPRRRAYHSRPARCPVHSRRAPPTTSASRGNLSAQLRSRVHQLRPARIAGRIPPEFLDTTAPTPPARRAARQRRCDLEPSYVSSLLPSARGEDHAVRVLGSPDLGGGLTDGDHPRGSAYAAAVKPLVFQSATRCIHVVRFAMEEASQQAHHDHRRGSCSGYRRGRQPPREDRRSWISGKPAKHSDRRQDRPRLNSGTRRGTKPPIQVGWRSVR